MELQSFLIRNSLQPLPEDFEFVWCTRAGTLPKRIQKYLHKDWGVKLEPSQISELGNIARRHCSKEAKTYYLDFTQRFNWRSGDFGDDGSCFWGDRSHAKTMLEDNGAFAVRSFDNDGYCDGNGRAWLVKAAPRRLILFNGYGETTLTFARLLSVHLKCSYKRLESLTNNGCEDATLYINGGVGFVVGDWSEIQAISSHDFGWHDCSNDEHECVRCGDYVSEDSEYSAFDRHGDINIYCSSCCADCDNCSQWYDSRLLENYEGDALCPECHEARVEADAEKQAEIDAAEEQREADATQRKLDAVNAEMEVK